VCSQMPEFRAGPLLRTQMTVRAVDSHKLESVPASGGWLICSQFSLLRRFVVEHRFRSLPAFRAHNRATTPCSCDILFTPSPDHPSMVTCSNSQASNRCPHTFGSSSPIGGVSFWRRIRCVCVAHLCLIDRHRYSGRYSKASPFLSRYCSIPPKRCLTLRRPPDHGWTVPRTAIFFRQVCCHGRNCYGGARRVTKRFRGNYILRSRNWSGFGISPEYPVGDTVRTK